MSAEPNAKARPAVLIVDDKEANLLALEAVLADLGCEVVRARSGNDALRLLLRREFALMLLDVQMPKMDGYEVARHSRGNPTTRDVPIIFVTATTESLENELRGYGTGAVDYLVKPVNASILRSKVQVFLELYLSRKRLDQEIKAHEKTLAVLQHSNAALKHFTRAASHDLGAPLRAMKGYLRALEQDAGAVLNEPSRHYLLRAQRATDRMRALLDSLLVFAGMQREGQIQEVDCAEVAQQVREDLAERLSERNATLVVRELPTVRGDRARLYQLFLNLIGNAIKYCEADRVPYVEVYVEQRDCERIFCVQDNGEGIAPEFHDRIFEAFQRLHTQEHHDGSGLGLAICRQVVEQLGGRIWVESEKGRGARFCFTLG